MELVINENRVKIEDLLNVKSVSLSKDIDFTKKIDTSHNFLIQEIKNGKPIYGVTTGYGESGKNYLTYEEAETLQLNLFRFHGCGVGEFLSEEESFYALCIRMISLSKGYSGISYELLKVFEFFINNKILPLIPSKGSVGASGDLTPLAYIASAMVGEGDVLFEGKKQNSKDVYEKFNLKPYKFKPKEALAIMNGTAIMSAIATSSIKKFETLLLSAESFVAGIFEVLKADITPLEEFVHQVKPFRGQIKSAKNIRDKLIDSKLIKSMQERYIEFFEDNQINIQDRYSIRCAPQVLGVIWDNLEISKNWVETELNSVNDNPLIDAKNQKIYTSGNFYGGYVAHAMDTLKISIANLADLIDKEFAILVDYKFNRGIGENLKLSKENYYHGFKAMQITLSSLSADVLMNTTPASIFSRPTESLNQDKVSMGTTSANNFKNSIKDLSDMLAISILGLAQAVDIRGVQNVSTHLKDIHKKVRSVSKPLIEDRRMDIDILKVKNLILEGKLI